MSESIKGILDPKKIYIPITALAIVMSAVRFIARRTFKVENLEKNQITEDKIRIIINDAFSNQIDKLTLTFDERYVKKN